MTQIILDPSLTQSWLQSGLKRAQKWHEGFLWFLKWGQIGSIWSEKGQILEIMV